MNFSRIIQCVRTKYSKYNKYLMRKAILSQWLKNHLCRAVLYCGGKWLEFELAYKLFIFILFPECLTFHIWFDQNLYQFHSINWFYSHSPTNELLRRFYVLNWKGNLYISVVIIVMIIIHAFILHSIFHSFMESCPNKLIKIHFSCYVKHNRQQTPISYWAVAGATAEKLYTNANAILNVIVIMLHCDMLYAYFTTAYKTLFIKNTENISSITVLIIPWMSEGRGTCTTIELKLI